MGRVGRCQGQAHPYSVGLAKEGLSFSFLDSRRPCSLVLKVAGDSSQLTAETARFRAASISGRWIRLNRPGISGDKMV